MRMCVRSISSIASTLATLPNLQYVNLGYNMLDGQLHRSCNLTSTKARCFLQPIHVIAETFVILYAVQHAKDTVTVRENTLTDHGYTLTIMWAWKSLSSMPPCFPFLASCATT